MNKQRVVWCCALAVTMSGVGALALRRSALSHVGGSVGSSPLAKQVSAAAEPVHPTAWPRAGWEAGVVYTYALEYTASMGSMGGQAGEKDFILRLTGRLTTRVLGQNGDTGRVELRLSNARVDLTGMKPQADVTAAFALPIYVDYESSGRARWLHVPPHVDPSALGVLRDLVAAVQVSLPQAPTTTWHAVEADPTGEFTADYRAVSGARLLRTRSESYARVAGLHGLAAADKEAPVVTEYAAALSLDDWGRLADLEYLNTTTKFVFDRQHGFSNKTGIKLHFAERAKVATHPVPSLEGYVKKNIFAEGEDLRDSAIETDRSLVAGADLDSILRGFSGGADSLVSTRDRLAALFRLDPSAVARARARLTSENAPAILGALATVGTPEAQRQLSAVLADEHTGRVERSAAIDAVMRLDSPTPETGKALEPLLKSADPELKSDASLALGIVAGHLGDNNPEAAHAVVERLTQEYSSSTDADDRVRAIGSLGNAGSVDSLPTLTQSMQSDDVSVRAASVAALRSVPGASADTMLANTMTKDASAIVRGSALLAAGFRDYEPLAPALETVAHGSDVSMRSQLVGTLSNIATRDAAALQLLDWMAQNDPDQKVRAQAQAALDRGAS